MGVEYKWYAGGQKCKVRIHDPDPSVQATPTNPFPNARMVWVVRISRGKTYMDPEGYYHSRSRLNPTSPVFDEFLANETHIPIIPPAIFP
jgi:hypothetical protein